MEQLVRRRNRSNPLQKSDDRNNISIVVDISKFLTHTDGSILYPIPPHQYLTFFGYKNLIRMYDYTNGFKAMGLVVNISGSLYIKVITNSMELR